MIIENKSFTGEDIENLNSIASDHLFMHAMQTNDWKKSGLQMYKSGQGCWVTDLEDNKFLDMMGGLWYKSSGYGQQEIADAVYKQISELSIHLKPNNLKFVTSSSSKIDASLIEIEKRILN